MLNTLVRDISERVFWTFAASVGGLLISWPTFDLADMEMWKAAATAGVIAVITLLKGVVASRVGDSTAALPLAAFKGK